MDKSSISLFGLEFITRNLDIRRLPGFDGDEYSEVLVAETDLWHAISIGVMNGDKEACEIDDKIFFYVDTEFIKTEPSDERLIEYIGKNVS